MPKLVKADNADLVVAQMIADVIKSKPTCVIGFATGSSPVNVYAELIKMKLDWSGVTTFNLDEYIGLGHDHPQSYYQFMTETLFKHTNIKKENINFLNGKAEIEAECKRYEALIKSKPIDLQLLGIGTNGHIAFNEPGSPEDSRTRKVELTQQTIKDNSRFFKPDEFQPVTAVSMGIQTILECKEIVLIAKGASKTDAIQKTIHGPKTVDVPASFLQKHANCTIVIDKQVNVE